MTPGNQSYHTTGVFLVAGALLLPPELVALMATVQHVPDWLKRRLPFHIQTFNIANYTLSAMAAWAAAHFLLDVAAVRARRASVAVGRRWRPASSSSASTTRCSRRCCGSRAASRYRETGLFSFENLSIDLVLAMLGVGVATLWDFNPWLIPFALAPLVLIHRSLVGAGAPGRGAQRPEDGALQRPALRGGAARGARRARRASSGRCR